MENYVNRHYAKQPICQMVYSQKKSVYCNCVAQLRVAISSKGRHQQTQGERKWYILLFIVFISARWLLPTYFLYYIDREGTGIVSKTMPTFSFLLVTRKSEKNGCVHRKLANQKEKVREREIIQTETENLLRQSKKCGIFILQRHLNATRLSSLQKAANIFVILSFGMSFLSRMEEEKSLLLLLYV